MFFVNEFFDERHFVNHYPKKKMKGKKTFSILPIKLENVRCKGKKLSVELWVIIESFSF